MDERSNRNAEIIAKHGLDYYFELQDPRLKESIDYYVRPHFKRLIKKGGLPLLHDEMIRGLTDMIKVYRRENLAKGAKMTWPEVQNLARQDIYFHTYFG